MNYQEYNVSQSQGVAIGSSFKLGKKSYKKGHRITPEDIMIFKMNNIHKIYGVEYTEGSIEYQTALKQVAASICGNKLGYIIKDEICLLVAMHDGIFISSTERIDKFNSFNPNIILNTIKIYQKVKEGDVVAKLQILPPLIEQEEIDDLLFRLSGNTSLLYLEEFTKCSAVFIYPHILENDETENKKFTNSTMKILSELAEFDIEYKREITCKYTQNNLEAAIYQALDSRADLIFMTYPLKGFGINDLMSKVMSMITDDIFLCSFPNVDLADIIIAERKGQRIIVLPYDFDKKDDKNIITAIKKAIFSKKLNINDFTYKQNTNLSKIENIDIYTNKIISPSDKSSSEKAKVGIVILAAGQGRRAGLGKLQTKDKEGVPLFMHAVNAAVASNAKPVFVITGYRREETEKFLEKLDVNIIYNPSYYSGVKTSIKLGLKAMPSSVDGAIILPADMPNIEANEINKMISKMDNKTEKQLIYFTHKGKKYNPVLWSKSLYDKADLIPENSEYRVIFAEHSDYIKTIDIKDESKLFDINFPNDIKEYAKK